jgi:hypothetical protein
MTRPIAALAVVLLLLIGGAWVVNAQTETLPESSCPLPEAGADFVICPEDTLSNGNGSFVLPTVWIRDERYGWLRMTACDGVIVACETNYVRAEGVTQGEAVEIVLDDAESGDGGAQG